MSTERFFFLIRHGETDWNLQQRLQGHSNTSLNTNGQNQAKSLSQRILESGINKVISSDLNRAIETAQLVFPMHKNIITTANLREIYLGQCEGWTYDQIINHLGNEFWLQWRSHEPRFLNQALPSGESKNQMLKRLFKGIKEQLNQYPQDTLAFVSHGLAMRTFVHHLEPSLSEPLIVENCGVLKFKVISDDHFKFIDYFDAKKSIK